MRRRISIGGGGRCVIGAAAWRRARGGSPAAAGPGRPARPPHRAGRPALRRCGGPRTRPPGRPTPAASSSSLKRTAPSPTASRGPPAPASRAASAAGASAAGSSSRSTPAQTPANASPRRASSTAATAPPPSTAGRERLERGHRHERQPAPLRERARRGDADPQPGEAAGPDADREPLDGVPAHAGGGERVLDERQQARRVIAAACPAAGRRARSTTLPSARRTPATVAGEAVSSATRITRPSPRACGGRRPRGRAGRGARCRARPARPRARRARATPRT